MGNTKTRRHRRIKKTRKTQIGGATYLALDCEMVEGPHRRPMVAEVGIVDWDGAEVYRTYVQPTGPIHDYRTAISGIRPDMLKAENGALPFEQVQRDVIAILQGNILVGHALENDLRALGIYHPTAAIRNTAHHNFFKTLAPRGQLQPQKLAMLYGRYVGNVEIQQGAHGALEDARAAMRVYKTRHSEWNTPVRHEGPILAPYTPATAAVATATHGGLFRS